MKLVCSNVFKYVKSFKDLRSLQSVSVFKNKLHPLLPGISVIWEYETKLLSIATKNTTNFFALRKEADAFSYPGSHDEHYSSGVTVEWSIYGR